MSKYAREFKEAWHSTDDDTINRHIDTCILIECVCSKMHTNANHGQPLGELTKYKCLVPAQNRLPNALAEEVEGGLNNFRVRKTI